MPLLSRAWGRQTRTTLILCQRACRRQDMTTLGIDLNPAPQPIQEPIDSSDFSSDFHTSDFYSSDSSSYGMDSVLDFPESPSLSQSHDSNPPPTQDIGLNNLKRPSSPLDPGPSKKPYSPLDPGPSTWTLGPDPSTWALGPEPSTWELGPSDPGPSTGPSVR
jgi:hypothetical protein